MKIAKQECGRRERKKNVEGKKESKMLSAFDLQKSFILFPNILRSLVGP